MSSVFNDNVSESKKREQQINDNQKNSEETNKSIETITSAEAVASTNNQTEKVTTTISSNDNKVNEKSDEVNNENTKTINKNKRETNNENNVTKTIPTTAVKNYGNKSNNVVSVVVSIDEKNKGKNKDKNNEDDVAVAINNNQNLNKADDSNKLTTEQTTKSTSPATTDFLFAATCCVSNMLPVDVDQQVASTIYNKQSTETSSTNVAHLQSATTIIIKRNNDVGDILTTNTSTTKEDITGINNPEISECNVKTLSSKPADAATATSPLKALPQGLMSALACSHLPHISSEPTFGVQMHNRNLEDLQHNNKNNSNPTSRSGSSIHNWRQLTPAPNCSSVVKSGTVSASLSPSMVRKTSDSSVLLPRRVSFPKSDNELVTGYLEPANPWEHDIDKYQNYLVVCRNLSREHKMNKQLMFKS